MFKCASCETNIGPHVSPTRVVIETRTKLYPPREEANDPGGVGVEVVKEVNVCPTCVSEAKK